MGGADVRIRLACFILLLASSCVGFAQLEIVAFNGLTSVCIGPEVVPNSTFDVGPLQVGGAAGVGFCLENLGASAITVTAITVTGADFSDQNQTLPLVVQPKAPPSLVDFLFAPSTTGTRTAQISLVDDASGSPQTFTLIGTGFTDFGLGTRVPGTTKAIFQGQTASFLMGIAGATSPPGPTAFNGLVTFSCSNLPQGASCAFSPPSLQLQSGMENVSFDLDVHTTATPPVASLHHPGFKLWYSLAAVFALVLGASRSRFKKIGLSAFFTILMFAISCGGGSSSKVPSGPTPFGTFQFQVNGTSNNVTRSQTLVLVVQ